jgi:hypothetical protein
MNSRQISKTIPGRSCIAFLKEARYVVGEELEVHSKND